MPLPFQPRSLDVDAAAYIQRSGATDRAAINAFVRGVKDLGLYDNMVCWPLRSTQNAGTGTTAYSLGGLGTYNGTLVNGPTWGVDGLTTVAGLSRISANAIDPVIRSSNSYTCIMVASNVATGTINFGVLKGGGTNQTGDNYGAFSRQFNFFSQTQIYLTGGDNLRTWGSTSFSASGNQFFAINRSDISGPATSDGSIVLNAAQFSNKSGTGNLPSTNPFANSFDLAGTSVSGNLWCFSAVVTPQSPATVQSIRTLYKQTLGQGLGLP